LVKQFKEAFLAKQRGRIERRTRKYIDATRIQDELLSGDVSPYTRYKQTVLIPKLEKALVKLQNGDYGYCEKCGRPIEDERLALVPAAELCMRCMPKRKQKADT
jgi:RNA polymerase-binding transcription factor DksA